MHQGTSVLPWVLLWGAQGSKCESILQCFNLPQVGQTALKGSWQNPWPSWLCRSLLLVPYLTARTLIKCNLHVSPGILGPVSDPFFIFQLPKFLVGAHFLLHWGPWALAVSSVVLQNSLCLQAMAPPVPLLWFMGISLKMLIMILIIIKKSCPSSSTLSSVESVQFRNR